MFERSAAFDENYFESVLETTPTRTHHIKIAYFEGVNHSETTAKAGVGLEVTIYSNSQKQEEIGYAAKSYPETTLRHNKTFTDKILSRIVRPDPTSFEKFLENKITDAFATTRMKIPDFMLDEIVEKTITNLEVEGAFEHVTIDIWEDYNTGSYETTRD